MSYFAINGPAGTNFYLTHDVPKFALGTRTQGSEGTEWVYVKAASAITAAGYFVSFDEAFSAAMVSTSNDAEGDLGGTAPMAFAASDYGWVQVKGPTLIRVAASCAANVPLNTTATAGQLDDDSTAAALIVEGAYLTAAREASAGTAAGMLNYPKFGIAVAATIASLTENATTIGGTNNGNIPTLAMSVSWDGATVFPSAADAALIIEGIRENAAKINTIIAALNARPDVAG